jgi:hypothetical protein
MLTLTCQFCGRVYELSLAQLPRWPKGWRCPFHRDVSQPFPIPGGE